MLIGMHMLLALFIFALQMHTDMGDERGIRLRCISLGRAALGGSQMRGMAICSKVSEPCFAGSSLSNARLPCADARCLCIKITGHKKARIWPMPSSYENPPRSVRISCIGERSQFSHAVPKHSHLWARSSRLHHCSLRRGRWRAL